MNDNNNNYNNQGYDNQGYNNNQGYDNQYNYDSNYSQYNQPDPYETYEQLHQQNQLFESDGRVRFGTAAKVILIIVICLYALNGLGDLISLGTAEETGAAPSLLIATGIAGLGVAACKLWLLLKRVRLAFFLSIAAHLVVLISFIASLPPVLKVAFEAEAESFREMGVEITDAFVNAIAVAVSIGAALFMAGLLALIFLLIRKQWPHMPMK